MYFEETVTSSSMDKECEKAWEASEETTTVV